MAVAIQPDGKIVVAGYSSSTTGTATFVTRRLDTNGGLDGSFGNGGQVTADFGLNTRAVGFDLALQPDGKVLVAGSLSVNCVTPTDCTDTNFALVRYNPNGTPDTTFGTAGQVTTDLGNLPNTARTIAIMPDGRIVVAGFSKSGSFQFISLARYMPNGTLDSTFGSGGTLLSTEGGIVKALVVQADGKIVFCVENGDSWKVKRLNADGTADTTFHGTGSVTTDFNGYVATPADIIVQTDGHIVVVGHANTLTDTATAFALARYNADGNLDTSFGTNGLVLVNFRSLDSSFYYAQATSLKIDDLGRLVVAGLANGGGAIPNQFGVMRFNANGSLDTTFGNGGKVATPFHQAAYAYDLALQADGKIVVVGVDDTQNGPMSQRAWAIARYLSAGAPTPTATASPTPVIPPNCIFTDVCEGAYFYTPVQYLVSRGAISGYSDGSFRPGAAATRGQLCKIVVAAEGWSINTTGGPHFTDVPTSNPFYSYIETAYNRGIISGYSDNTFRWGAEVTRGQLSKIIVNAQGWVANTTGSPHFTDVPSSNPFYSFIETAYNHGIISGYSDNTFRWGNPATRGQISKIVYLALNPPAR
jgi:uncharacterized delta-60 repeat protein